MRALHFTTWSPWLDLMTRMRILLVLLKLLRRQLPAGFEMIPRSTPLPVILLTRKPFVPQPMVQAQLVVLETFPRLHDLVFLVTKER
ncbi:hypothetical protein JG687_00017233 [Phytophthora cactorum]|uniref:Secreted protein n=1 Tax=Phytophthora cactorum TaxID=29920 RepID=A0A8T1TTR9_9STRA|nr:hypothetical protein JG687_00017233 [Phytophthora cactorum]